MGVKSLQVHVNSSLRSLDTAVSPTLRSFSLLLLSLNLTPSSNSSLNQSDLQREFFSPAAVQSFLWEKLLTALVTDVFCPRWSVHAL